MKTCRTAPSSRARRAVPASFRTDRVLRTAFAPSAALLLAACGGAGGDDDPVGVDGVRENASEAPVAIEVLDDEQDPELAIRRLEARLTTRVVDAVNHDSWICLGETLSREYRLAVVADGTRRGRELDGHGLVTDRTFDWAAIGADTLLLDYPRAGTQTEIAAIRFADDDAFRASDGADGTLECRRQRYVDGVPTRGAAPVAPEDVDREVEAAAALVARVETRRIDGGDFWYCESDEAPPSAFVLASPGVLDDEPRALVFDASAIEGGDAGALPTVDVESPDARAFSWLATDGATLVLVPIDADVAVGDGSEGTVATLSLGDIVFPIDDAFTATDGTGRMLQCLRVPFDG